MSLPELFPFHGDWDRYEEDLYEIYLETIVRSGLTFGGVPVRSRYGDITPVLSSAAI